MQNNKKEFLSKSKLEFYKEIKKYQAQLKPTREISGFASSALVGEKNYPCVQIHSISNQEQQGHYFDSSSLVKQKYSNIIPLKAKNILGSSSTQRVKHSSQITQELQDIYKSRNKVEFESRFQKELSFNKVVINKLSGISGSQNPLEKLQASQNTQTSKQIEKYSSGEIKAKEAVIKLYKRGINEHQIINLLALGNFGIQSNKKLVPSKWAISAYDQIIEEHLYKQFLTYPTLNVFEVYSYNDKGNEFLLILLPYPYLAEVVEIFPGALEKDFVSHDNKLKTKEPQTAGGYWATKIGIHEHLVQRKKQAAYLSVRIIENYEIPLGVIFVREALREALKTKKFSSNSLEELKEYIKTEYKKHYPLVLQSRVLKETQEQRSLRNFFH